MYILVKQLHILAVTLSLSFFVVRAVWMVVESPLLKQRWTYYLPQIIDTVLLLSALTLTVMLQQYPFVQSWLTAKVCALLVYIVCGAIALRRGRTRKIRYLALGAALVSMAYLLSVARFHHPWPLSLLF